MTHSPIQLLAIALSLAMVLFVIHLVRRRQLQIEYSIVWLIGGGILILFSVWRGLLEIVAGILGIYYAPAVLLLLTILVAALGFLHFSVRMSKQAKYNKQLAQEVSILKNQLESLTKALGRNRTDKTDKEDSN